MGELEHHDDGTPDGCDDPDCVAAAARGDRWIGPHCSVEPSGRAHFHHVDDLRAKVAASHAAAFAETCERYRTDPTDVAVAWSFLQHHPIFWRPAYQRGDAHTADKLTDDELASPTYVEDADGLRDLWTRIDRTERGVEVQLEHGPHLWPGDVTAEHRRHYPANGMSSHDPALDVAAPTYEAALVALAGKVYERYGVDRSRV